MINVAAPGKASDVANPGRSLACPAGQARVPAAQAQPGAASTELAAVRPPHKPLPLWFSRSSHLLARLDNCPSRKLSNCMIAVDMGDCRF